MHERRALSGEIDRLHAKLRHVTAIVARQHSSIRALRAQLERYEEHYGRGERWRDMDVRALRRVAAIRTEALNMLVAEACRARLCPEIVVIREPIPGEGCRASWVSVSLSPCRADCGTEPPGDSLTEPLGGSPTEIRGDVEGEG